MLFRSIEREVEGIDLAAGEWLELLTIRTTGKAKEVVDEASNLGTDNERTVAYIWKEFELQYQAKQQPGQQLLQQLQAYPEITLEDTDRLNKFARLCRQASMLAETNQGTDLAALNTPYTQLMVTGRLDNNLREKWKAYAKNTVGKDAIPFDTFTSWISDIAEDLSDPRFQ